MRTVGCPARICSALALELGQGGPNAIVWAVLSQVCACSEPREWTKSSEIEAAAFHAQ